MSREKIPDATLLRDVQRKLMQKCSGTAKVSTFVRGGDATVSGSIKNEYERKPIIKCIAGVPGIRRVIDQLLIEKRKPIE